MVARRGREPRLFARVCGPWETAAVGGDWDRLATLRIISSGVVSSGLVASYAAARVVPWNGFAEAGFHFWIGDAIGIVVILPPLLLLYEENKKRSPPVPSGKGGDTKNLGSTPRTHRQKCPSAASRGRSSRKSAWHARKAVIVRWRAYSIQPAPRSL